MDAGAERALGATMTGPMGEGSGIAAGGVSGGCMLGRLAMLKTGGEMEGGASSLRCALAACADASSLVATASKKRSYK